MQNHQDTLEWLPVVLEPVGVTFLYTIDRRRDFQNENWEEESVQKKRAASTTYSDGMLHILSLSKLSMESLRKFECFGPNVAESVHDTWCQ